MGEYWKQGLLPSFGFLTLPNVWHRQNWLHWKQQGRQMRKEYLEVKETKEFREKFLVILDEEDVLEVQKA